MLPERHPRTRRTVGTRIVGRRAVLGKDGGGASDGTEVEAAMLLARLGHSLGTVALGQHHLKRESGGGAGGCQCRTARWLCGWFARTLNGREAAERGLTPPSHPPPLGPPSDGGEGSSPLTSQGLVLAGAFLCSAAGVPLSSSRRKSRLVSPVGGAPIVFSRGAPSTLRRPGMRPRTRPSFRRWWGQRSQRPSRLASLRARHSRRRDPACIGGDRGPGPAAASAWRGRCRERRRGCRRGRGAS
eukprot:scaffold9579_cov96-Isochrysis_galbana.AAC.1